MKNMFKSISRTSVRGTLRALVIGASLVAMAVPYAHADIVCYVCACDTSTGKCACVQVDCPKPAPAPGPNQS